MEREKNLKNPMEYEKKKSRLIIPFFLLILVLSGVIAGCLTTSYFNVNTVEVENGINVSASKIQRYFEDVKGKNTFLINTSEIEKKIESLPYIYTAKVSRSLPDKLTVKYEERKPYAIIKYLESYVLLDSYSTILEVMQENSYEDLPIIYGIDIDNPMAGEELAGTDQLKYENVVYTLKTAEHLKSLDNSSFDYTISEIDYTDIDAIKILTKELDVRINYGKIDRTIMNDKLTYLNQILKELKDKKGTLDISSSNYSEKVIFSNSEIGGVSYEK